MDRKNQSLIGRLRPRRLAALLGTFLSVLLSTAFAGKEGISLHRLTGPIYLVVDDHYVTTNSLVYIGPSSVTVIGATWTPDTARILAGKIKRLTNRPIREVIDTSPDPEWSGGNGYWKSIGAKILAIDVTAENLKDHWGSTVEACRKNHPDYPELPLVLPTQTYSGEFELQAGHVRAFYLGPSHTRADIFVYFPKEKVLDAGSILKEQLGNMAKADVREYPNTLHKLQDLHLDIRTIISGHWSPVHGPELVDHYLQLLALNHEQSRGS
jgi:metallo-beta-lactamase class B